MTLHWTTNELGNDGSDKSSAVHTERNKQVF